MLPQSSGRLFLLTADPSAKSTFMCIKIRIKLDVMALSLLSAKTAITRAGS